MMQPVVIGTCQPHRPIAIALQADIQTLVRIKHGQRGLSRIEKAQPQIHTRIFPLLRRQCATRPAIPRKQRVLPFPRHSAKLRRQKFPQLAISFEHVTVRVDDWVRTFHTVTSAANLRLAIVICLAVAFYYCPIPIVNNKTRKTVIPSKCQGNPGGIDRRRQEDSRVEYSEITCGICRNAQTHLYKYSFSL